MIINPTDVFSGWYHLWSTLLLPVGNIISCRVHRLQKLVTDITQRVFDTQIIIKNFCFTERHIRSTITPCDSQAAVTHYVTWVTEIHSHVSDVWPSLIKHTCSLAKLHLYLFPHKTNTGSIGTSNTCSLSSFE